jgi:hypothetical protein
LRFTQKEVEATGDGMDVQTLNLKRSDIAALQVARDPEAIAFLHKLNKGSGFKKISDKNVQSASAIGVISMKGRDADSFLQGGRVIERIWLEANHRHIAVQPISQIVFMTELILSNSKVGFSEYERNELSDIYTRFRNILKLDDDRFPVFVLRFFYSGEPVTRSLRRPLDEVFFINEYQR